MLNFSDTTSGLFLTVNFLCFQHVNCKYNTEFVVVHVYSVTLCVPNATLDEPEDARNYFRVGCTVPVTSFMFHRHFEYCNETRWVL